MVLDCYKALKDTELQPNEQLTCALYIFYKDFETISQFDEKELTEAVQKMTDIMDGDRKATGKNSIKLKPVVDFEKDFPLICSSLLPILGYDIREKDYLHWWTFLSAFREIKEGVYAMVLQIRVKQAKGIPLEKEEQKFYRENKDIIDIEMELTEEEREFLFSD
jgi:hypothetical protein